MRQYLPKNPQGNTNGVLRITQLFGARPSFYKRFGLKGHEGLDTNPTPGVPTPIYAVEDGNTYIKSGGPYGNRINLYNDTGLQYSYSHLSKVLVSRVQRVKTGDLIGYSGKTSNYAMPVHLHFMVKECNPKTGAIYNKGNGYAGSIPVHFDKVKNMLYIDTAKEYIKEEPVFKKEAIKTDAPIMSQDFKKLLVDTTDKLNVAKRENTIMKGKIDNAAKHLIEAAKELKLK